MIHHKTRTFKKAKRLQISLLENKKEFSKGKKRSLGVGQHANKKRLFRKKMNENLFKTKNLAANTVKYLFNISTKEVKKYLKISKGNINKFIELLHSRLDNIVFKSGFAKTRKMARQLISHKKIQTGGSINKNPQSQVKIGTKITLSEKAKKEKAIMDSFKTENKKAPNYLKTDENSYTIEVVKTAKEEDLPFEIVQRLKSLID